MQWRRKITGRKGEKVKTEKKKVGVISSLLLRRRKAPNYVLLKPEKRIRVVFSCPDGFGSIQYAKFFLRLLNERNISNFFDVSSLSEKSFDIVPIKELKGFVSWERDQQLETAREADYIFFSYADEKRPPEIIKAVREGHPETFTIRGYRENISEGHKNIEEKLEKIILKRHFREEE